MGIIYVKTTGNAANSGTSDNDAADLSGAAATVVGSVVTLDGLPNLSALVTSGAAQSAIHLSDATNSNQKIFWITAFDDTLNTVTVSVAPTGVVSSAWRIGGRHVYTPASVEATLRAGDILEFGDSPASRSGAAFLTMRVSGDKTSGPITIRGKVGVRPQLIITDTNTVIDGASGAFPNWSIQNLELIQQGASGVALSQMGFASTIYDVKISDAGGDGFSSSGRFINCEVSGIGGTAINSTGNTQNFVAGCYLHDVGTDGILMSGTTLVSVIINTIIDTVAGRGIRTSGAPTTFGNLSSILGCTIYACGNSGIEINDGDYVVNIMNCILVDNGNAAGEYNVEWVANAAECAGYHSHNVFFHAGGGGGANLLGLTVGATESTTDPALADPANGDFTPGSVSAALAAGFPGAMLGGPTGYLDIGAIQRQPAAGGGGPIFGGMVVR